MTTSWDSAGSSDVKIRLLVLPSLRNLDLAANVMVKNVDRLSPKFGAERSPTGALRVF